MRAQAHLPVHTALELLTPNPHHPCLFNHPSGPSEPVKPAPLELGHGTGVQFYPASFRAHFNTRHTGLRGSLPNEISPVSGTSGVCGV